MPKIRDIICHVSVEIASRSRICHRNRKEHSIQRGEACLVVKDDSGGKKNYCHICAAEIQVLQRVALPTFRPV
jgi:hypothetical protein